MKVSLPIAALALTFCCLVFPKGATAQDQSAPVAKATRPDIPGLFLVDFGLNQALNQPKTGFKRGFFGSRTLNVMYYLPIRLGQSKFTLNPGVGFAMERFKWANFYLLKDTTKLAEVYDLVPNRTYPRLKKSQLIMNYLEVPLEFRFDANPADPSRTFWASVGGQVGFLISSQTKLKYKDDGIMNKLKDRDRFGLNPIRYSAILRFGVGGFGWFVNYNLTPLFQTGKGPRGTDLTVLTAGITINGL